MWAIRSAVVVLSVTFGSGCERASPTWKSEFVTARYHLAPRTDLDHAARVWRLMGAFEDELNGWIDIAAMRSHVTHLARTNPRAAELLLARVLEAPVVRYPVFRAPRHEWPTPEQVVVDAFAEAGLSRLAIRR